MCTLPQNTVDQLSQTIRQFLDENRMFTAYDVTLETRQREQVRLRHEECRQGIHEIQVLIDAVEFGHEGPSGQPVRWIKSQVTMPNSQWAFVYHPDNVDPSQYQTRSIQQAATPQKPAISRPATAPAPNNGGASISSLTSDSGGLQNDGTYGTDYRNRLLVPTKFLKDAGLRSGDEVSVLNDQATGCVILVPATIAAHLNGSVIITQRVERNGDIRLSSRTLTAAGFSKSTFTIESQQRTVAGNPATVVEVK